MSLREPYASSARYYQNLGSLAAVLLIVFGFGPERPKIPKLRRLSAVQASLTFADDLNHAEVVKSESIRVCR
jgi:hypothetical protein